MVLLVLGLLGLLLAALVLFASVVATRETKSRAEAVVAASLVFNALIVGPVYVLGLVGLLTRPALLFVTASVSGGIVAALAGRRGRAGLAAAGRRLAELAWTPFAGIAIAAKQRSLVAVAGAIALFAFPYMLLTAWLAPAFRDYDALWYHEPIVAFTIQNHGFAKVALPNNLQVINGVPRLCEMTQLWFAMWTGRRLVDVANVVFMPLLAASMFSLARRFSRDVVASLAWASALVLMPGFLRLVQSSMVDPQSAALLLAAAYFVTHPELDAARTRWAALALALAVGAKIWFVVPVGLLSLLLAARLLVARGWRPAGLAALPVLGMAAVTYGRNWILFGNPFWPMLRYDNAKLGIHWKGELPLSEAKGLGFNDPFPVFYEKMLGSPFTATGTHHQWQIDDYGFAWAWIVLPLAGLSATLAVVRFVWCEIAARYGTPPPIDARADARAAAALAVVAAASLYLTPALHIARYHVASVGMLAACICWLFPRRGRRGARLAEHAGVIAALGSVLVMYWALKKAPYSFIHEPEELARWMKAPPRARPHPAAVVERTAIAREIEIGDGSIVAFEHVNLAALLWNDRYSNRVVWLSSYHALEEAERIGATWVYSRDGGTLAKDLAESRSWELVGPLERDAPVGKIWRRRR
jgi:hypothetical protein